MKNTVIIMVMAGFILSSAACEKTSDDNKLKSGKLEDVNTELIQSGNTFGINLFKEVLASEEEEKNVFISPLSVSFALAMTYNGAAGDTKTAFENTLGFEGLSTAEINKSFEILMDALLNIDEKVLFEIANSIWYRNEFQVEEDFLNNNQSVFDTEIRSADFADPNTVDVINDWIAKKTKNKITDVLDFIPYDAVMYLINAIYFKGIWQYQFDPEQTSDRSFYLYDGTTVEVPAMVQKASLKYLEQQIFEAVELPYGDGHFSMVVLLPKPEYKTTDILAKLNDENWNNWMNAMNMKDDIEVSLPKFKFTYGVKLLNDELINLGLGIAFSGQADFSKINPDVGLFISRVLHKTFVEVNEEGTEAAAVTVVEMRYTSVGDNNYFTVNRPFLFVIKEKETNAIIFMGKVYEPGA